MPHGRRRSAPLLLLLAAVALAAIAVAPRGMLRAAAAADEARPAATGTAVVQPTEDDLVLPGVRQVVAREEDGVPVVLDDLTATGPRVLAVQDGADLQALPAPPPPAADAPERRTTEGERAPPRPI